MKKITLLIISTCILLANLNSQNIELTFTAFDNTDHIQLDSIKVMNRTQEGDTVLYWPDTVLTLYLVGTPETAKGNSFQAFQNYPNPIAYQTTISLYVPEKDNVHLIVSNILGRVVFKANRVLEKGLHSFQFTPSEGSLFFFTAQWRGTSSNIKLLNSSLNNAQKVSIEYLGSAHESQFKSEKAIQDFNIDIGDELLFIGYNDTLQSGMLDSLDQSKIHTFQFAYNIPCPGTPTVEYNGQVYNTVQILSQCWLKENLNVGTMIPGNQEMEDNNTIEKYCYGNNPANCDQYGGLYKWNEMMQYNTQQGIQGICPPGWHLPTDEEWKVLEGAVDSQYRIGDQIWNSYGLRGYDAGTNLKSTSEWNGNGNGTDLFGFLGLPGGYLHNQDYFYRIGQNGLWWSSTEGDISAAWNRYLSYNNPKVDRDYGNNKRFGFSVRCVKD